LVAAAAAALASVGCGSSFSAAPADASSDHAMAEESPKDAGTEAEAGATGHDATADSMPTLVCPEISTAPANDVCRGYLDYEIACGLYSDCDCSYWQANCKALATDSNPLFDLALYDCVLANLKASPPCAGGVVAVQACAYQSILNSTKGLSSDEQNLLMAYCAKCDSTDTACLTASHPFVAEYDDEHAKAIMNDCVLTASGCGEVEFEGCVARTLGVKDAGCDGGGS
jgi:hypothetical protein